MKYRISEMESRVVSKEAFEAWEEWMGAKTTRWPLVDSSKLVIQASVGEVLVNFQCTALNQTPEGSFYGRNDEYTHVRIDDYNCLGPGARSSKVDEQVKDWLIILGRSPK